MGKMDRRSWLLYSAVVFSHPLLDMITSPHGTNMGVMLFWPFSQSRFAAGLMTYPLHDSTTYHGLELLGKFALVSIFEFIVFAPVLLLVIGIKLRFRATKRQRAQRNI